MNKIEKVIKRSEELESANGSWRSYCQNLAKYVLPRKARITAKREKGSKLQLHDIYDSTAIRGLKIMAAGFHSNLTNPSSKWFNLRTRDLRYMDLREVKVWFKDIEDIIFGALSSSNFDTTMQEFYLNSGCFGTGIVLTLEDALEKIRFTEIPIGQVGLEEDAYGRVQRVYRTFELTVQQAYDLWGTNAGPAVTERINHKPDEELKFIHFVGPREKRDVSKADNINMPYESLWVEKSKKHLIAEGGFKNNPYAVGRFYKATGEVFGFSPCMDVLPDIKLVNAQVKTMLRAAMKQADPALIAPRRGFIAPLNANPGRINYRDEKTANDAVTQMPTGGNIPVTLEVIQQTQAGIEKALFVPLFQALSQITKQMTVPEVQRRIHENMVLLGPVVGRFTQEMLDPIIMRVFDILYRNGEMPMPPAEIQGQDLDIVYISPLARAQKESEIYSIQAFMQDVGLLAQADPSVLDNVDYDKTTSVIAQIRGISPEIMRSDGDVEEIRQQRAEQQEQMAQQEHLAKGAEIVATAAGAGKDITDASRGDK